MKTVVITGANSGIGLRFCKHYLSNDLILNNLKQNLSMNIRNLIILALLLNTAISHVHAKNLAKVNTKENRPNIIVILADDLGYNDVGFTGATEIQTPNIDNLANNGITFTNGYVTHPYCGPSRAGLLTGRAQARFGMENNVSYLPDDPHMGLPLDEKTFAKRLQQVGYNTAMFGKWHLGGAPHFQPTNRGFDYFYGFLDGGHNYMPGEVEVGGEGYFLPIMRNTDVAEFDEYLTTALSNDAARYINNSDNKPFLMYLAYNAPHAPLQAPQKFIDKYSHIKDKERRVYAAMVDAMDEGIGKVVSALKKENKLDNTLIFFLSDNGGVYPEAWLPDLDWADNSPFRRGKVALLEGGVHVPFIAHWPNKIPKGIKLDGLVSSLDIAATSVALAGADDSDGKLEGINLIPFAKGDNGGSPHQALFWRLEEADQLWAVRTVDSKYLRQTLPNVGRSFFDMKTDPTERNNIVDQYPDKQAHLANLWNEWNSKNINNIHLQKHEYDVAKKKFFTDLYKERIKAAAEQKTYQVK